MYDYEGDKCYTQLSVSSLLNEEHKSLLTYKTCLNKYKQITDNGNISFIPMSMQISNKYKLSYLMQE